MWLWGQPAQAAPLESEVAESNGGLGAYQALDRKIDNVEHKVEQDLIRFRGEIREDFQTLTSNISQQIRSALGNGRSPQVVPLIGTAIGIVTVLGSVIGFIYNDLGHATDKLAEAQGKELALRTDSERRIYDALGKINDTVWHKDAQGEFERREDEERDMQFSALKDSVTVLAGSVTRLAGEIVPRAEHDRQWANDKEMIARVESGLNQSLNRLAEHVNKGDDRNALKFDDLDKATHPYGTADVVKDFGLRIQDLQDKLFRFLLPGPAATAPTPKD